MKVKKGKNITYIRKLQKMIINASGRTDICAFYSEWFINRIKEGYLDVRNPFYKNLVSRIILDPKNIDLIVFCTKNPIPMLKYLSYLKNYNLLFQITITPYLKEIENKVPNKKRIIESIKYLSKELGKERIFLRYDPIFMNKKYNLEYHTKMFDKILNILDGYIDRVIISFIDFKKNTTYNKKILNTNELNIDEIKQVAVKFSKIAQKYNIKIQTCAEKYDLLEYGFINEGCLSPSTYFKLTGKTNIKKSKNRKYCKCIETVDIGVYNTCLHFCKYCYANYDEKQVLTNIKKHNKKSSLLVGNLEKNDILKIRN